MMNMDPLREVATTDQAAKEYRHMAALREALIRMKSSLKHIEFSQATFTDRDEASMVTRETWDYTHVNTRTGAAMNVQQNVRFTQGVRLFNLKEGDKLVSAAVLDPEEDEPETSEGEAPQVASSPEESSED